MRSAFPALVGFLIILGAACWFDAHASDIAGGVGGSSDQLVQSGNGASSTTAAATS